MKEELIELIKKLDDQITENNLVLRDIKERETKLNVLNGMLIAHKQLVERELQTKYDYSIKEQS